MALSATKLGVDGVIVMPKGTPAIKVDAGRQSHLNTVLYISSVILYIKNTGWRQNDFNSYA